MPSYEDTMFDPPAPVSIVTIRAPESGVVVNGVPLLIDSGADVTLLPKKLVEELHIVPEEGKEYQLLGFDGNITSSKVVRVDLIFLRKTFKGRFLLTEQDYGILGRDVLNNVCIILNGLTQQWEECPRD